FRSLHAPTPHLAISGLRVFGKGGGKSPGAVRNLKVVRQKDRRDVQLNWTAQADAQGYNILWGIAPDKLYSSWMVYGQNEHYMRTLTVDQGYYFAIEAFNENGVSKRTKPVKVD
ncbi:MAG: fibronectin type III domain-containing protein, partial [Hymenobacteraceae bacterium]|nr:fibronectin type III domain-containing protein [Hymenobacteraceae bacterium]